MARRVILLKGDPVINEERTATEVISPGHLLMIASATTVSKNTGNAANVVRRVALEREELGAGIDTTYGTATPTYAVGDIVKEATLYPGCRAYMLIPSGQNIAAGNYLEADNAGRLVVYSAGQRLFQALEAVNNSAGPGDARIRVEAM